MITLALIITSTALYGIYNLLPSIGHPSNDTQPSTITVIDGRNQNVTIKYPAGRVVSLASSVSEVICALNASDILVGVDKYSTFPPYLEEKINSEFNVGSGTTPNIDLIVVKDPDVVFAWPYCTIIDQIEAQGIPVYVLKYPQTVSEVIGMIKTVGLIVGKEDEAEEISGFITGYVDIVKDRTEGLEQKPLVYFELKNQLGATGNNFTLTSQLITLAGGVNIAENETLQYVTLNNEDIIYNKNPDVIIKFYQGAEPNEEEMNMLKEEIMNRPGWNEINAVKNGKVYIIHYAESSINPRLVIGLIRYAKWIHPELFQDIDIDEVKEYTNNIYGMTT